MAILENNIMPIASFSVLLPDGFFVSCNDLLSAETLCTYLDMQDDHLITYTPVVFYTVTLPDSRHIPFQDLHSAEMLCDYLNELNAPTEPKKDDFDKDYDQLGSFKRSVINLGTVPVM